MVLYTVLLDVDNSDQALMAEMTAQIFFVAGKAENTLTAPLAALRSDAQADVQTAQVLAANGEVQKRQVRTGISVRVQILDGLSEGDRLASANPTAVATARGSTCCAASICRFMPVSSWQLSAPPAPGPTSGDYLFAGENVAELGSDELAWLRREAFGFVFQGYHLIPSGSAQENVEMPAIYAGTPAAERHAAWPHAPATGRINSPAASSNGCPSPAP